MSERRSVPRGLVSGAWLVAVDGLTYLANLNGFPQARGRRRTHVVHCSCFRLAGP